MSKPDVTRCDWCGKTVEDIYQEDGWIRIGSENNKFDYILIETQGYIVPALPRNPIPLGKSELETKPRYNGRHNARLPLDLCNKECFDKYFNKVFGVST